MFAKERSWWCEVARGIDCLSGVDVEVLQRQETCKVVAMRAGARWYVEV